ncbi:hypothetical protein RJ639_010700, partial [Escallonia herrerae]
VPTLPTAPTIPPLPRATSSSLPTMPPLPKAALPPQPATTLPTLPTALPTLPKPILSPLPSAQILSLRSPTSATMPAHSYGGIASFTGNCTSHHSNDHSTWKMLKILNQEPKRTELLSNKP